MPGLDPGIQKRRRACRRRHWIAGSSPAMTKWIKPDPLHCHARARPGLQSRRSARARRWGLDRRVKPGDDKVDKAQPYPLSCPGSTRASRNGPARASGGTGSPGSSPAMTKWIKPDPFHCHARARPGHPETATRVQVATLDRRVKPGDDKVDKARPSPLSCPGSTRASRNGPRSCKRWGWIAGSSPAMTMGGDRTPCFVMPGLDPGIHSRLRMCKRWDWIAGSSPAMTREVARGGIVTSRLGVGLLVRALPRQHPRHAQILVDVRPVDAERRELVILAFRRRSALQPRIPVKRRRDASTVRKPDHELGRGELDGSRAQIAHLNFQSAFQRPPIRLSLKQVLQGGTIEEATNRIYHRHKKHSHREIEVLKVQPHDLSKIV